MAFFFNILWILYCCVFLFFFIALSAINKQNTYCTYRHALYIIFWSRTNNYCVNMIWRVRGEKIKKIIVHFFEFRFFFCFYFFSVGFDIHWNEFLAIQKKKHRLRRSKKKKKSLSYWSWFNYSSIKSGIELFVTICLALKSTPLVSTWQVRIVQPTNQ